MFEIVDGRTNRQTDAGVTCILLAHPWAFGSGELKRYAQDIIILERGQVKDTVTWKWYSTLRHPKMHPYTKFVIHTLNNVRDMLRSQLF